MRKRFLMATWAVLCTGCYSAPHVPNPVRSVGTNNRDYSLDELFTDPKGFTVYRFWDGGDWRYYVVGPSGGQMIPSTRVVTETETETDTIEVDVPTRGGGGGGSQKSGGSHPRAPG